MAAAGGMATEGDGGREEKAFRDGGGVRGESEGGLRLRRRRQDEKAAAADIEVL